MFILMEEIKKINTRIVFSLWINWYFSKLDKQNIKGLKIDIPIPWRGRMLGIDVLYIYGKKIRPN
jgi:hypothetical protein